MRGAVGVEGVILDPSIPFLISGAMVSRTFSALSSGVLNPCFFGGIKHAGKEVAKFLGREALRTGSRILNDIADIPQAGYRDIISKHVQDTIQNLGTRMKRGKGRRRRKRRSTGHGRPPLQKDLNAAFFEKHGRSLDAKRHLENALFERPGTSFHLQCLLQ
jgi:hypothetical protein